MRRPANDKFRTFADVERRSEQEGNNAQEGIWAAAHEVDLLSSRWRQSGNLPALGGWA